MSAINWALSFPNTQNPGGYYSWADVRSYYLKALTLGTKTERDTNFAQTFRGVGQLMHLIQDMSVPEHTRNDGHYVPYIGYEDWVAYPGNVNISTLIPFFFTGAISSIKSFMDTDTFTGSNPEVTAYSTIGLSEYTQANFFSEDTINNSNFPNPKISDTTTTIVERNFTNTFWNTTYPRQYYLKNCCGETNNNQGYLLSAVDYLDYYRMPLRCFSGNT